MSTENVVPQKLIDEFVERLRQAAGKNLQSAVLWGSAATGEFHPEYSNLNLLCLLREISLPAMQALKPTVSWWTGKKYSPPLLLTREELERSADVFSIEWMDMKRHHRVLYGDDPLANLVVPTHLHRAQVEYELREKLILLREHMLLAVDDRKQLWSLLLNSLRAFTALFRHALIALGEAEPANKRESIQALARHVGFEPRAFLQVLDVRENHANRDDMDLMQVAAGYLTAVQQTVAAVDKMLDSPGTRPA